MIPVLLYFFLLVIFLIHTGRNLFYFEDSNSHFVLSLSYFILFVFLKGLVVGSFE